MSPKSDVELWGELVAAVMIVAQHWPEDWRLRLCEADVVLVYLWSVFSNRPMYWACRREHWPAWANAPYDLPEQSTLSRRSRRECFTAFLEQVGQVLADKHPEVLVHLRKIDGKVLLVAKHSKDPDATFGGPGGKQKGYKLHAVWEQRPMPEQAVTTPLNVDEKKWRIG